MSHWKQALWFDFRVLGLGEVVPEVAPHPIAIMVLVKIIIKLIGGNIRYELSRVHTFFGLS